MNPFLPRSDALFEDYGSVSPFCVRHFTYFYLEQKFTSRQDNTQSLPFWYYLSGCFLLRKCNCCTVSRYIWLCCDPYKLNVELISSISLKALFKLFNNISITLKDFFNDRIFILTYLIARNSRTILCQ